MTKPITNEQYKILSALLEDLELCPNYNHLEVDTQLSRGVLEVEIRKLKKLGLVCHRRGLMDDEGMVAGSGFNVDYKNIIEIRELVAEYETKNPPSEVEKLVSEWGLEQHRVGMLIGFMKLTRNQAFKEVLELIGGFSVVPTSLNIKRYKKELRASIKELRGEENEM